MLRALPIVWRVVLNAVIVGIALAVLAFPTSDFEKLVVALLVLIYVSVLSWSMWILRTVGKSEAANVDRFVSLLRNQNPHTASVYSEQSEELEWATAKGRWNQVIAVVANGIIAIAAVYQVIDVIS
jgi:hypothetical protein